MDVQAGLPRSFCYEDDQTTPCSAGPSTHALSAPYSCGRLPDRPSLAAQDIAVNGIKLGMTLQEAQAKLPPDMHISTPKTDFPPQFTTLFAQRIPFTGSDIDDEVFTIEAVDGKVAYVKQIITYSPARAIDRQEFQQSLVPKYGPMSPYPPNVTPAVFPIWLWIGMESWQRTEMAAPGVWLWQTAHPASIGRR